MSNSSLVSYTNISPNKNSPRKYPVSKITIHHMAGNLSVEQCGSIFANAGRQASSNYGIGSDGRIGLYVDEGDRSWCSSNAENDNMAVTIEVANDNTSTWTVSDKALEALIDLCTDICKRNGIGQLVFTGDKNGNLTMHRYFAATYCPGDYLASKFPYIADEVNKRLRGEKEEAIGDDQFYEKFKCAMSTYKAELQNADASAWSADDREWAISTGLIKGSEIRADGSVNYMWQDSLTREQAVSLLHRLYNLIKN